MTTTATLNQILSDLSAFVTAEFDGFVKIKYEMSRKDAIDALELMGLTCWIPSPTFQAESGAYKRQENCWGNETATVLFDHAEGKASIHFFG